MNMNDLTFLTDFADELNLCHFINQNGGLEIKDKIYVFI